MESLCFIQTNQARLGLVALDLNNHYRIAGNIAIFKFGGLVPSSRNKILADLDLAVVPYI